MIFDLNARKLFESRWFTLVQLLLGGLLIGVLSLYFAATMRHAEMFQSYFDHHLLLFLNLAPVIWLILMLWCVTGRAALSFGLCAGITIGLSVASWFKLQFRNDPLLFEDLLSAKEAGNMLSRYSLFVTKTMAAAVILLVACGVVLHFTARGRLCGRGRMCGASLLLLLLAPARTLYTSESVYQDKTQNFDLINRWSATQLYISKGFVYPFLYSVNQAADEPPAGYDAQTAAAQVAQYEDADIPEGQKVDVISIMLEAYNDFSKYDEIAFARDVYEEYHKLEAEGISGNLITNIFAGGTIDTERCFLTGFDHLGSFRTPTNAYPRYFAGQGYTVTGGHPSYSWFYNRANINENLGFERYDFMENHYGLDDEGEILGDDEFLPELIALHEQHKQESDKPYFSFSVTYQGHGPYDTEQNLYLTDYVETGRYSQATENILNNYFGSIADTNEQLAAFFDHYRALDDPVVIVLFGDHNPWLGDGNSAYDELGIDLDFSQAQGFRNYYGTRYLIWANDAAKRALGRDFTGEGPDIGPYFLMNEVFRACGWDGPAYMQATNEVMDAVPVISTTGLRIENGELTSALSERGHELVQQYLNMEYYWRKNFQK